MPSAAVFKQPLTKGRSAGSLFMHGFTLMELLIALTLLGLVTVLLYGGLYVGTRSWEAGEQRADATETMRLIHAFIRRELSQAYPLLWESQGEQRVAFRGEPQALHFAAVLPAHRGVGGIYLLSIKMAEGAQRRQLVFSYRLAKPEIHSFEIREKPAERVVLLDGLEEVKFSYYGKTRLDEEPRWHARWGDSESLPRIVRLRLKTRDTLTAWPDLVIPIHAQVHPDQAQLVMQLRAEESAAQAEDMDEVPGLLEDSEDLLESPSEDVE